MKISVFVGGLPHICGSNRGYYEPNDECQRYVPSNDSWIKSMSLGVNATYPTYGYHKDWGLIISYGNNSGVPLQENTVSLIKTGDEEQYLTTLPSYMRDDEMHCLAAIDDKQIFVAGLGLSRNESFMYNRDNDDWTELEQMPLAPDEGFGCGVAKRNGQTSVLVFGSCGSCGCGGCLNRENVRRSYSTQTAENAQADMNLPRQI